LADDRKPAALSPAAKYGRLRPVCWAKPNRGPSGTAGSAAAGLFRIPAATPVVHQEIGSNTGVDQALDQQDVLIANLEFVAEENFEHAAEGVAVLWLDELADPRNVEVPHQIGEEHEAVLEDPHRIDGFAFVVIGNLAADFAHALLDLLGRNDDLGRWSRVGHIRKLKS
jgi:hypothetical protein